MAIRLILLAVLLSVSATLRGGPVSRETARQRAAAFLSALPQPAAARGVRRAPAVLTDAAYSGSHLYVYNVGLREGFVIVSGDDRTAEILGYADSGTFDEALLPANARSWLRGYADEMAMLDGVPPVSASAPSPAASPRPAVRPLLTTLWAQREPYNGLCPEGCAAGCVATAMAQVMKYYEWPRGLTAAIPGYGTRDALPPASFGWHLMLDGYTGSEPAASRDAVARLVQYCGWSVEMSYGSTSSAFERLIPVALHSYFGYDAGARRVDRSDYTIAQWDSLIYGELAQGRPVIYSGQKQGSGHEFVCDGYDGNGLYHINWGWAGTGDGYFRLSVLTPSATGTGGGSTKGGYNLTQSAVVGIRPDEGGTASADGEPALTSEELFVTGATALRRSSLGSKFTVKVRNAVGNHTSAPMEQRYGLGLMRPDGTLAETLRQGSSRFNPGAYAGRGSSTTFSFGAGQQGTYRIVAVCSPAAGRADWRPALASDRRYIEAVLTDTALTLTAHPLRALTVDSLTWHPTGGPLEVLAHVTNHGDEYNGSLCLRVNGSVKSTVGTAIAAGASDVVTFYFTPTTLRHRYEIGYTADDAEWIYTCDTTYQAVSLPDAFSVWDARGRQTTVALDGRRGVVPDYAAAADFRSLTPDSIIPNGNPNTLYYLSDATRHARISGYGTRRLNVITKTQAEQVVLTDGHDFFCPVPFTAGHVFYTRVFTAGYAPDGSGWDTVVLPFDVDSVYAVCDAGLSPLGWFRSPADSGKQFWLMDLCESSPGELVFAHSPSLQANRPCLVAVPGPVYGDASLVGVPVVFSAAHAVVHATDITGDPRSAYRFTGTYAACTVPACFVLDGTGTTFVRDDQPVQPFRAYLVPLATDGDTVKTINSRQ